MAPSPGAVRRLLVSIHDVGPRFEREVEILREHLGRFVPLDRVAMLVVPNHWGRARLVEGSPFAKRLREWAGREGEVFVHGWYHRDDARHAGALARLKARHMTAGEGEFLGLDTAASLRRMVDGRAVIEDVIGRAAAGFIAPAWLYGPGARAALAASGLPLAEDHWRVWRTDTGAALCRGPVVTWASRSRARIASSLLAAKLLRSLPAPPRVMRMAVHPGDAAVPALMDSIACTLDGLADGRVVGRYGDLLAEEGQRECVS